MRVIFRKDLESVPASHWRQQPGGIRWPTATMEQMNPEQPYPVLYHLGLENSVRITVLLATGERRDLDIPYGTFNRLGNLEV